MRRAFINAGDCPCYLDQRVAKAIPFKHELSTRFLFYLLDTDVVSAPLQSATTGISVPHISTEQLLSLLVPAPPIDEQEAIVNYLDERCATIDSVIETRAKQISRLEDYRKALIFQYVTGKKEVPHE